MVTLTSNEIVIITDIDTLFKAEGWDTRLLRALETNLAVGVLAHFDRRTAKGQLSLTLHPSLMAFRRMFLERNKLDLRARNGNDPGCSITNFLWENKQFNPKHVRAILPTTVEFPNGWFPPDCVFGKAGLASHGFCTAYGDMFFHFWHSMNYYQSRDIMAEDGRVLVPHSSVRERVAYHTAPYL